MIIFSESGSAKGIGIGSESDPTGTVSGSERIRIPPTQYELRYPSSLPAILVNANERTNCPLQIKRAIHQSPQSWKPHGAKKFVIKPVCRDSSEINHCMLLISFGKSGSYLPPSCSSASFLIIIWFGRRVEICLDKYYSQKSPNFLSKSAWNMHRKIIIL
jgi:hypothetical protein